MTESEIKELIDLYERCKNKATDGEEQIQKFGESLNSDQNKIKNYINNSISLDLSPNMVLFAIFESIGEEQKSLVSKTIKFAIKAIMNWNFQSIESASAFALATCKIIAQVSGVKTAFNIMVLVFKNVCNLKDEVVSKNYVAESLLTLIPPLYKKLSKEDLEIKIEGESKPACEHTKKWLNEIITMKYPDYAWLSIIDTFSELSLNETQLSTFIESVFSSINDNQLPLIVEKIFTPIRKHPKLTLSCLNKFITKGLVLNDDIDSNSQIICSLIKKLYTVSTSSRLVLNSLVKILTGSTGIQNHFTPFLLSLAFSLSGLAPKIKDSYHKFFNEQLKIDAQRIRSKFLSHIYNLESCLVMSMSLESAFSAAINLSKFHLESNAHYFVEFAFTLIDNTSFKNVDNNFFYESNSEFLITPLRQIHTSIEILKNSLKVFPSSSIEVYEQIVQRLISNSANSIYLIQCLDSPEHLLEVINYIQYLDLNVVEQLMKFAIPKISQNDNMLDKAVINSKKVFFNRTEKAKLNGVAALFYLILPMQVNSFTQYVLTQNNNQTYEKYKEYDNQPADEDIQFEIFSIMRRGLFQSNVVQEHILFFIPFLLKNSPRLKKFIFSALKEKLDLIETNETFPIQVCESTPYLLDCIYKCLRIISNENDDLWSEMNSQLNELCFKISEIDFDFLLTDMTIFENPELRESVIAIILVFFNNSFRIDKDIALSLFRLYDRINHKKQEIEKLNHKDNSFKTNLIFPHFMDINDIEELFKLFKVKNGDYSDNYGIQLYALEMIKKMIDELSNLRLEMIADRLNRAFTLGKILFDSLDNVKWSEPPAGIKSNLSLLEILTKCCNQLISFVFETYDKNCFKRFLQETGLISKKQNISDSQSIFIDKIKQNIRTSLKCAEYFNQISEKISLYSTYDNKIFEKINKIANQLIHSNSPFAGNILHLASYFAPTIDFQWLSKYSENIIERVNEEESGSLSSMLMELMLLMNTYLNEINTIINFWLPHIYTSNQDESQTFSGQIATYLEQIEGITKNILEINFQFFPQTYYETIVKLLNEFYKTINKFLLMTLTLPESTNENLNELMKEITSNFDENNYQFISSINEVKKIKKSKYVSIIEKFNATNIPMLCYIIDKVRSTTKTLVHKKLLDQEIIDNFCELKGLNVSIPKSNKKKSKVLNEEEESIEEEK